MQTTDHHFVLFRGAALAAEHPSVSVETRPPVIGDISFSLSAGLRQHDPGRHSIISPTAAPVGDESRCSAGVLVVEVRPHHPAPSPSPLAEGF
jgi:hypothetical protein